MSGGWLAYSANTVMELKKIDKCEYQQLLEARLCSKEDMYRLASYPYVSLLSRYENLSGYENKRIREIEDINVSNFLHVVSTLFGIGSQNEVNMLNRNMNSEPLRSAVIAARQETDPTDRMPKYIELACKILLSIDKQGTNMLNAINIKINGKIPASPFSNRQRIADDWYRDFVEIKLNGMKKVYKDLGGEDAYIFIVVSTLQSLYHFASYRYNIRFCNSENEALHKILKIFKNNVLKNSL